MVKKLALAAICVSYLGGNAMAQDAKTVVANAQKALGDPKSITYSGSAKDVAFQQCGGNASAMTCQGTHDPMRPITSYVRVIDLAAPTSRHTGGTRTSGAAARRRRLRERSSSRSRRNRRTCRSPGAVARAVHHAVGLLERRRREQRDREPAHRRRQELHRAELEPRGQGAVRQELRDQRLPQRPESRRARRDVARREHHGRHAHRRDVFRLEGLRRRDGAREDRADARRMAVLRRRRDGGQGESSGPRDARASACATSWWSSAVLRLPRVP